MEGEGEGGGREEGEGGGSGGRKEIGGEGGGEKGDESDEKAIKSQPEKNVSVWINSLPANYVTGLRNLIRRIYTTRC